MFTADAHHRGIRSVWVIASRVQPVSNVDHAPATAAPHRDSSFVEKRFARRRSMVASGMLGGPELPMTLTCAVRDTSSTGALIELTTGGKAVPPLPSTFTLTMPMERVEYDCRLVWVHGRTAGIMFTGPARMLVKRPPPRQLAPRPNLDELLTRNR